MNDEAMTTERVRVLREALTTISQTIGDSLQKNKEPSSGDAAAALNSVLTLCDATIVAFIELSHNTERIAASVGKIAEIMQRDYGIDVSMQAEMKAEELQNEKTKRSFIGQSTK